MPASARAGRAVAPTMQEAAIAIAEAAMTDRIGRETECDESPTYCSAYLPATEETYCATASICAALNRPLKAGIAPPPTSTWCITVSFDGFS